MSKSKRHLRNYLLDRKFQLRFTVLIVLLAAMLTSALGYFWYSEMRKASRIIEVKALATMSDEDVAKVQEDIAQKDRVRLAILGGFGVLLAFILAIFSIVFTHKIAGPLFKITRHLLDIKRNNFKEMWDLRKGDQLQEFWAVFKAAHTALRDRQSSDIEKLKDVVEKIAPRLDGEEQKKALEVLENMIEEKEGSLEGTLPFEDEFTVS